MALTPSGTQLTLPSRPLSEFGLSFYYGANELQLATAPSDPAGYAKTCEHIAAKIAALAAHSLFARQARAHAYKSHDVMDIRVTKDSITFRKEGEPTSVAHTMLVDDHSPLKPLVDEILRCANTIRSTTTLARTTTLASPAALASTASLASLTALAAPAALASTLSSRPTTPDPRLAQMDAQIQAQAATLATNVQTIADRDAAIVILNDTNRALQATIDAQTAEITALKDRIAPLEAELTAAKDRIVELERQLATANATIAENATKLLELAQLKTDLAAAKERNTLLSRDLAASATTIAESSARVRELEDQLTASRQKSARFVSQTQELKTAVQQLTEEKDALTLKIATLEEQVKPLEEGIASLTRNVEELINTNSDLRAANAALSEYLDAEKETSRLVKADLALRDTQIRNLESTNHDQAAQVRSLQDRVRVLELENEELKALSRESSISFASATSQPSIPDSGVDVEEFERKLEAMSTQEDILRQALGQQEEENTQLHAAIALLSTTINGLKEKLRQEQQSSHTLRLEVNKLGAVEAEKRKAISAELAETNQLLEEAEAKRSDLFFRLLEQTATVRTLKMALQEASDKHAQIIAGFEAREQELETDNRKLTLAVKQKETTIRDMRADADKQEDRLQHRIAELEQQHARDEAIFRQLRVRHEKDIAQITEELDAVKATLAATEKAKADQDAEFALKAMATIEVFTNYEARIADAQKQIAALEKIRDQAIQVGRELGYIA